MNQRYDAQNSYVTLGNQLLLANQMLQQLMVGESTMDRIESIEELIGLLEGMLSPYYQFMSLNYFSEKNQRMIKFDNYEKAMIHLSTELRESRKYIDDKMTRSRYIYWLNRKYQLLSSCYGKLKLVPELSGGADMGAVEDQIPDEVSEIPQSEWEEEEKVPIREPVTVRPTNRPTNPVPTSNRLMANRSPPKPVPKKENPYDDADFELVDEPPAE